MSKPNDLNTQTCGCDSEQLPTVLWALVSNSYLLINHGN